MKPAQPPASPVDRVVAEALALHVAPGMQWAYARLQDRHIVEGCAGRLSDEVSSPQVTTETVFDLASLTKPLTALTAVRLVASGVVVWDAPCGDGVWHGDDPPALGALLSHRAGLAAWAPLYEAVGDATGEAAWQRALTALHKAPCAVARAGAQPEAVYSDLGYILAGRMLEAVGGLPLSLLVAREVTAPLGLQRSLAFRGVGPQWRDPAVAPTEACPWRGRVMQGEVHDENAYALGGVAGHAGIFGTAGGLARLGLAVLEARVGRSDWLSAETVAAMLAPQPGGSHRIGWDARSGSQPSSGAHMGPNTFGHLGFTGTSLWCDPDAGVVVALVTNRVHPRRDNLGIRAFRPAFHDAVMSVLGRT